MKHDVISFSSVLIVALFAAPVMAWADARPDFDDDAKPILRTQPGLLEYVESRFQVKNTGTAKYPGDDDHRPGPPYIFRARPLGSEGPFNLRLLIQPGEPGHVLGVVDITKVHLNAPGSPPPTSVASQPEPPPQQAPVDQQQQPAPMEPQGPGPVQQPQPQQPAPQQPSAPTADTPSGPIMDPSQTAPSNAPSLSPPPDPAPDTH